jgi:hypothetical protein
MISALIPEHEAKLKTTTRQPTFVCLGSPTSILRAMWACIERKVNCKKHKYTNVKSKDSSREGREYAQQGRPLATTTQENSTVKMTME